MVWAVATGAALCVAVTCWLAHGWMAAAMTRYRQVYTEQAGARLSEVFLFVDPRQLWVANVGLCLAVCGATYAFTGSIALAALAGGAPVRLPHMAMAALRRRRQARFDSQLPDALLALASGLRAGASVPGALRQIVDHCDPPLSQEFGLMLREQRLGLPFDATLGHLLVRMPTEAAGLVVSALRIAAHTGGNLSETLEGIASTLRARERLRGRIDTLTAQGRLQAWIVGALAPVLALVLDRLEPVAMAPLWHTPAGWTVLAVVTLLEIAGVVWIRRIVSIDI